MNAVCRWQISGALSQVTQRWTGSIQGDNHQPMEVHREV